MKKAYIFHLGTQHVHRLANGLNRSNLFSSVHLFTGMIFRNKKIAFFKTRIKPLDNEIKLINNYVLEFCYQISSKICSSFFKSTNSNVIYVFQYIFGLMYLPLIWLNRKKIIIITFETSGIPIVKYAKKWNIPIVMDFPSISYNSANKLGIEETTLGKIIKDEELKYIDFALFCSNFCKRTFSQKMDLKNSFVLHLGTELYKPKINTIVTKKFDYLKIAFIGNVGKRKGLDILLEALHISTNASKIHLFIIGNVDKNWLQSHLPLGYKFNLKLEEAMPQEDLFNYLINNNINLHVLPSRFDSFGMVVPETMSLGIPSIVSPNVGASEIIEHDTNGFILESLNKIELSNMIDSYIKKDQYAKEELSRNAFDNAKKYSWEHYYERVNTAFHKILSENKND